MATGSPSHKLVLLSLCDVGTLKIVPHVVVTTNNKITMLLLHNSKICYGYEL